MPLLTGVEAADGKGGEADNQQRMGGQHGLSQSRVRALVNAERGKSPGSGEGKQDRHEVEGQDEGAHSAGHPRHARRPTRRPRHRRTPRVGSVVRAKTLTEFHGPVRNRGLAGRRVWSNGGRGPG
jgi:hypothetical protein